MARDLLVPLDGSPLAEHVLPYAAGLARVLDARVVLLHVRCSTVSTLDPPDLRAIAARLQAEGVTTATHVHELPRHGQVGQAILGTAAELDAGLIVMATHGRSGLGRLVFGSVADQVLRETALPVLLVAPHCERQWTDRRPLRVLVPLDGSEFSEAVLPPLRDLFGPSGADVTVLRVVESIDYVKPHSDQCDVCRAARARGAEPNIEPVIARRYVEGVAARLQDQGMTVTARTEIGLASSVITTHARSPDVDLIAMATHGRSGLARVVLGSVATGTLRQAPVPVLLVRPGAVRPAEPEVSDTARPARTPRPPLTVGDIMTTPVLTAGEDATLEHLADRMLAADISSIPIVDSQGRLAGIVTESDFRGQEHGVLFSVLRMPQVFGRWLPKEAIEELHQEARTVTARDVMHRPVVTAAEDEPVTTLVSRMIERRLRHLPVVRDGVVVGIVTRHDVLRMMAREG